MRSKRAGAISLAMLMATPFAPAASPATRPDAASPPAWVAKDSAAWPQILLSNRVADARNAVGFSGSAGLVRLPNGVIVLMTAKHLLGDAKPADFAKAFKSWTAVAVVGSSVGARMTSVAMDTADPSVIDALVLLPATQQSTWPATVLTVRQEPLQPGDVVYLVGIPVEGSKGRQAVHKGEVVNVYDDHFEYTVEGTFKTTGNSGAPVLDAQGRFAAINTAHLNEQNEPGHMKLAGVDAATVLQQIKLPKGMKPLVLATQPAAGATADAGAATASDPAKEAAAEKLLLATEVAMMQGGSEDDARHALQAIIKKYPGTEAAKKANEILHRR